MRKPQLVALLILIAPLALTACGQKGPLFIAADQAAQPADAADKEAEKKKSEGTNY